MGIFAYLLSYISPAADSTCVAYPLTGWWGGGGGGGDAELKFSKRISYTGTGRTLPNSEMLFRGTAA
jgi:hypothetical protein